MNVCWKDVPKNVLLKSSVLLTVAALATAMIGNAQDKKPTPDAANDVLVLSNGDTLHGKLVKQVGDKVTFHTDAFGDVDVSWDHIKELHSSEKFGVLQKSVKLRSKKASAQIPIGPIDATDQAITVHGEHAPATPIPVKDAVYIVDAATLDKQINQMPSFFSGWNGAATAGATLVQATQNQYTVSGALALVRVVPSVSWLDPRNRTQADVTGSFGKITEPGTTPVKSAIFHGDFERDQYLSSRLFGLVQVAYDHNFSQDLQLQQIYGAGLGWTLFSTPRHEADVKGTVQYEKQQFISTSADNQNLIGSTFAANYMLHAKLFTFAQAVAYIPAYNNPHAYSANETNAVTFSAYKNFGLSVGTIDSYLNNPPATVPPTKRNSFQFTMGLTYAIKSKY